MRILVTGAGGMLGTSIVEALRRDRPQVEVLAVTRRDADLRDPEQVARLIDGFRPDGIVHAAAVVGGIAAKLAHPTRYLMDNMRLDSAVIDSAIRAGVPELLYLSSAVVYPQDWDRPFVESDVLTGALEPANEGYGLAKLAGLKLCSYASREFGLAYRAAVPANLYGPYDHFELGSAHLIAATIAKVHAAREAGADTVEVWGDGTARREFVYSEELAAWLGGQLGRRADWPEWLNLGQGSDRSIADYYEAAKAVVGFEGRLHFDVSKPAGVPRRLLDSSRAAELGWAPATDLHTGMSAVYRQFLAHQRADS